MVCINCGKSYIPGSSMVIYSCLCEECTKKLESSIPKTPIRYGWICPKCGKVNSPDIPTCPCSEYYYSTLSKGTTLDN